jgi:hypothetical protein
LAFEIRQAALQLNELRLAKGSPASTAVENHQSAPSASCLVETDRGAVLVREDHVREAFSYGRTDLAEVNAKIRDHGHTFSFIIRPGLRSSLLNWLFVMYR